MLQSFVYVKDGIGPFVELYKRLEISYGFAYFYEIMNNSIADIIESPKLKVQIDAAFAYVRSKVVLRMTISQTCDVRIPTLCRENDVCISRFIETMKNLCKSEYFSSDMISWIHIESYNHVSQLYIHSSILPEAGTKI